MRGNHCPDCGTRLRHGRTTGGLPIKYCPDCVPEDDPYVR